MPKSFKLFFAPAFIFLGLLHANAMINYMYEGHTVRAVVSGIIVFISLIMAYWVHQD